VRVPSDGRLKIPKEVLKRLNIEGSRKIHLRITKGVLSDSLRRNNVTDDEIDRIATVQFEPRENVVRFLSSESKLSGSRAFRQRARTLGDRS
jgi:hypothetical protein